MVQSARSELPACSTCPRKLSFSEQKLHFLRFTVMQALFESDSTVWPYNICWSAVHVNITLLSKCTTANCKFIEDYITTIAFWKVPGAIRNPNRFLIIWTAHEAMWRLFCLLLRRSLRRVESCNLRQVWKTFIALTNVSMHSSNLRYKDEWRIVATLTLLQSTWKRIIPSSFGISTIGKAYLVLADSISSILNIISFSVFQIHMPLALLCTVHTVLVELRLKLVECGSMRYSCNLDDHPIWIQTCSSFNLTCQDMHPPWGQSWPFLSIHVRFRRRFHIQPSCEAHQASFYHVFLCIVRGLPPPLV